MTLIKKVDNMGVIIKWTVPDTDHASYDKVYIYKATSRDGTYNDLTNQLIADNSYFDIDGSTANWYKVRFYDSDLTTWSDYSEPTQGGDAYGYCGPDDIYDMTPLTTSDISYTDLSRLIGFAICSLNSDINIKVKDEIVEYISYEKENKTDGSNTTFYTKKYPIGDYDNDGEVLTGDIQAYTIDGSGTRTTYSVSSIDDDEIGKFTLSSAPSSNETLYLTYVKAPLEEATPHYLIKKACIFLSAALAHTKVDTDKYKTLKLGRLSAMKFESEYTKYMTLYNDTVYQINDTLSGMIKGKGINELDLE
jgi:hypothetical protein